jgi:hypothetical protein
MAQNKRAGRKSLAQNDFLGPETPTGVSATDVGTNRSFNNGSAVVSFTPAATGPAATSFQVIASTGPTQTGTSSPITISGLSVGTTTFVVKAINSAGESTNSSASSAISITTVPDAPTSISASSSSSNNGYDVVSWSAPTNNGGKAITNYYVTSSDGKTANTTSTSVNISQEGGTSQTYNVYADNANGRSSSSAASTSVTTFSFTPFSFFGFTPFSFSPFSFFSFGPFSFSPFSFFGFAPKFGPRLY